MEINIILMLFLMNSVFLARAYNPRCHALQVPEYHRGLKVVTKRFVDGAHGCNLKVHVWTVNKIEDMQWLMDLGVDGIITDYPDRLLSLLDRRG